MEEALEFKRLTKYKHMKPRDVAIWERFIAAFPDAYKDVRYDVMVGDPPPFNPLMDNGEDWNQDALYRLKIDVVGYTGDRLDIIEIKPMAGPSTVGQIEAYHTLFMRDEQPQIPVNMMIVTDDARPNMRFLCDQKGISLVVV